MYKLKLTEGFDQEVICRRVFTYIEERRVNYSELNK